MRMALPPSVPIRVMVALAFALKSPSPRTTLIWLLRELGMPSTDSGSASSPSNNGRTRVPLMLFPELMVTCMGSPMLTNDFPHFNPWGCSFRFQEEQAHGAEPSVRLPTLKRKVTKRLLHHRFGGRFAVASKRSRRPWLATCSRG